MVFFIDGCLQGPTTGASHATEDLRADRIFRNADNRGVEALRQEKPMKTILLADDEANLRILVRTTLDDSDYHILEAADGTAALDLARRQCPDLLVLDWMMPGINGLDVARALRQDPSTAHIPIIMLTARGQETDKAQGHSLGTYAYLVKPFSPLELLQKVREALG